MLTMKLSQRVIFGLCHVNANPVRSYNRHDVTPHRSVRKTIFSLRLWRPRRQRVHSQRRWSADPGRSPYGHAGGLTVGCINACSINNKGPAPSLTRSSTYWSSQRHGTRDPSQRRSTVSTLLDHLTPRCMTSISRITAD